MRFVPTRISGVHVVGPEPLADDRGFFARTWDPDEFERHGLIRDLAQCSVSWNRRRGTLRGLHWQDPPWQEAKLVRCTAGAIFDVAVDLRPESPTYADWVGVRLTAEDRDALYVPPGCAHGFLTLTDGAEVFYQISQVHHPEAARGARWDDPMLSIGWPSGPQVISDRDRTWPDLELVKARR